MGGRTAVRYSSVARCPRGGVLDFPHIISKENLQGGVDDKMKEDMERGLVSDGSLPGAVLLSLQESVRNNV